MITTSQVYSHFGSWSVWSFINIARLHRVTKKRAVVELAVVHI